MTSTIKNAAVIKNVQIVKASDIWPDKKGFVIKAIMVSDINRNKFREGEEIRTSLLIKADFDKGLFETQNTIYCAIDTVN